MSNGDAKADREFQGGAFYDNVLPDLGVRTVEVQFYGVCTAVEAANPDIDDILVARVKQSRFGTIEMLKWCMGGSVCEDTDVAIMLAWYCYICFVSKDETTVGHVIDRFAIDLHRLEVFVNGDINLTSDCGDEEIILMASLIPLLILKSSSSQFAIVAQKRLKALSKEAGIRTEGAMPYFINTPAPNAFEIGQLRRYLYKRFLSCANAAKPSSSPMAKMIKRVAVLLRYARMYGLRSIKEVFVDVSMLDFIAKSPKLCKDIVPLTNAFRFVTEMDYGPWSGLIMQPDELKDIVRNNYRATSDFARYVALASDGISPQYSRFINVTRGQDLTDEEMKSMLVDYNVMRLEVSLDLTPLKNVASAVSFN
jgi:hypothetical protein